MSRALGRVLDVLLWAAALAALTIGVSMLSVALRPPEFANEVPEVR